MNVNYTILFWVMFVVNIIGLCYLVSMVKAVNDLIMRFGVLDRQIEEESDSLSNAIFDMSANLRDHDVNMTTKLNLIEADIGELVDECTPEPGVPEPCDLETSNELVIEVDELPIHLITPNQYFFEHGHDKFDMKYDAISGDLLFYFDPLDDSRFIIVDNVAECVGDGLTFFGVNSKNESVVYVRNNLFKADFMIETVN